MYNKFRAVSSIQVILNCVFSCFSRYGITILFQIRKELQWKALKQTGSVLGLIIVLFLSKGMFSFLWVNDDDY
jgi:hypothetical protein